MQLFNLPALGNRLEPLDRLIVIDDGKLWPFAFEEIEAASHGMRHNENIGEDDRRIEIEPSKRLERHFGGISGV